MRFIFKTSYEQDLRLAKHGGHVFWYGLLGLGLTTAPWLLSEYLLAQLTFILIYSVVGLGLMILAGFTGLFSIGHAAFLGVGAYTQAVLTQMGWPFPAAMAMAALLSAAVGVVVGLPALRVKGIYLGIATLSFGFIVEEVFARWDSVTGGNTGKTVGAAKMFGWAADTSTSFYFVCLVVTVLATLACANLLRSPTGRAFVAIRDSEISAEHGHPPGLLQDPELHDFGGAGGIGRRFVCTQIAVHQPRSVQCLAIDRFAADGGDWWIGLDPRGLFGGLVPDHHAAADFAGQRVPARCDRAGPGLAGGGLWRGADRLCAL